MEADPAIARALLEAFRRENYRVEWHNRGIPFTLPVTALREAING